MICFTHHNGLLCTSDSSVQVRIRKIIATDIFREVKNQKDFLETSDFLIQSNSKSEKKIVNF